MNSKRIFIVYFTSDVQNDIHYKISWNPIYSIPRLCLSSYRHVFIM